MRKEEAVANFFISLGTSESESEDYMTNLRLNKLMYFAQAWSLVLLEKPLFSEQVEAWPLGPVIPSVYHKYKQYGKRQITTVDPSYHLNMLSEKEQQVLLATMAYYGDFSTRGLVDLSHEEGSPWAKACDSKATVIQQEDIRNYFAQKKPIRLTGADDQSSVIGYRGENGNYILPQDWK